MIEIRSPEHFDALPSGLKVFIAGSIENGGAEDWQAALIKGLRYTDTILLNPRRREWSPDASTDELRTQITWELGALEAADLVVFYFAPDTRSPISLLELGLMAGMKKPTMVCCPEGFWRKTNVDVVCERFGLVQVDDLRELARCITVAALSVRQPPVSA